jgi:hypothetical protein
MGKESGLGHELYVDGWDLSDDIGSVSRLGGGCAVLDLTGIRQLAFERRGGIRDGSIEASSWFNPTGAHAALSTLPTTDRVVSYLAGTAPGRPAACLIGKQPNYDPTRNADANLPIAFATQGNGFGLEWGEILAARAAHAGATNGTPVDLAASTSFGLQAYLHVHAFTGTSVTVVVQDSADGSTDWQPVTGAGFTAVSAAPAAQRIQTARDATVRRHLRIASTGTFTSATVSVIAVKNVIAAAF